MISKDAVCAALTIAAAFCCALGVQVEREGTGVCARQAPDLFLSLRAPGPQHLCL